MYDVSVVGILYMCHILKKTCRFISGANCHYNDGIRSAIASQMTGISIVSSTLCSGADRRKHQNSASLAFARGIHRWPADSSHKGPATRKMFPFDGVIMVISTANNSCVYSTCASDEEIFRCIEIRWAYRPYFLSSSPSPTRETKRLVWITALYCIYTQALSRYSGC